MALLKKSKLNAYILANVKKLRRGWRCTRIGGYVYDRMEGEMRSLMREFVKDPIVKSESKPEGTLLVVKTVRGRLVEMLKERYPSLDIRGIDEDAMDYLGYRLEKRLKGYIQAHPARGQTFTFG